MLREALRDVLLSIRDYFSNAGRCMACEAHILTITALKDQLHRANSHIEALENQQNEILRHITGMNKVPREGPQEGSLHSIPRRSGIQERIRRAEVADRNQAPPIEARRREYNERIESLLNIDAHENKEIEVLESDK